ncbi:metalloenzyme superfamily-domain-containing protein [Jimgerdemannia flammicorona]|uniref:Metalloenzyme superfamily-domain-containing protein n=1 Tax=Jimgerdemannia flammicorona TaxID=994334 RepID=A0A433DF20_9FUNG|nr:metalloenzyme superfamily-domain-containing protein [Jimgerdemannia flammicorona]
MYLRPTAKTYCEDDTVLEIMIDIDSQVSLPSFPAHSVAVKYATEHRCGVRVRGPNLTDAITGTDPLKDKPTDATSEAHQTSKLINELSETMYAILTAHPINVDRIAARKNPANCVLLRGCGSCIDVPSIRQLHGFKGFMIAPTCIIAGLGMTVGMDILNVPGATGDYQTDLMAKGKASLQALRDEGQSYDFGFIHIKAVDDAGHDRNVELKLQFLERIDTMIGYIATELAEDEKRGEVEHTFVLTGDHSTPVLYGDHSCEPVPFTVCHLGALSPDSSATTSWYSDFVTGFSECAASHGVLGRFCGSEVMGIVKRYMGIL